MNFMTVSSIGSTSNVADLFTQSKPAQKPASSTSDVQDTVQLSAAALKAGDVDHDGDSH